MARSALSLATIALTASGCTGLIDDGGSGGLTGEQKIARQKWTTKALPRLDENCTVCHNGSRLGIGFLEGTDELAQRDTLVGFDPAVVNLDAPASSRLLTKGLHEGPALLADQASDILDWLQAERDAVPDTTPGGPRLETARFAPLLCTGGLPGEATCPVNTVALDDMGIAGARVSFVAQGLASGLYVTNLRLVPGGNGAFVEHPLFVSWPLDADPVPDSIDRFFDVKLNLSPAATAEEQQIGGGTAAFVGFGASDEITIHFKAVDVYQVGGPGGGGGGAVGCKELASFKANAQQPINAACASCHAGANPNATSAMNITGIVGDDAMIQRACNQVRTRVNLTAIDQSSIYLATLPGNANHPFTFNGDLGAHAAFKGAVDVWANAEKVAP